MIQHKLCWHSLVEVQDSQCLFSPRIVVGGDGLVVVVILLVVEVDDDIVVVDVLGTVVEVVV